ncbi:MAG: R3H domain-containing nucleic acid-binding protein [Pseudanabaenaceae cyanobacterium SKYGB_i_bin29]|nr:RNA-binding protein [Pseudanabaenaceae cyanobacterium SKYG29]MDW8421444.1 R3H domain-containing nucleic acid-binding protein [Pseudanabaenaceae cyanobacterium SKYGB_i_bin29]
MTIVEWLQELLRLMGFTSARVKEADTDKLGNRWLVIDRHSVTDVEASYLIGDGGSGLDALQTLVNLVFNQGHTYIVELDGFRQQQLTVLEDMAKQALAYVRASNGSYTISRLSPAARRYIHLLLKEYSDVETFSEGEEPNRQLIVRWVGVKDA